MKEGVPFSLWLGGGILKLGAGRRGCGCWWNLGWWGGQGSGLGVVGRVGPLGHFDTVQVVQIGSFGKILGLYFIPGLKHPSILPPN